MGREQCDNARVSTSGTHSFDLTPEEAAALQEELRERVVAEDRFGGLSALGTAAGVDVGFDRRGREARARAAVAVLSFPDLEPVAEAVAEAEVTFPYVPGLLSFRELPVVLRALERLERRRGNLPALLVCDAHGRAHPRRFGLACHLGVLADLPTVGVAKSLLVGEHGELPRKRGARRPLVADGADGPETVGTALRTRTGVRPVYVSVGHRVSLDTAVELTLALAPRYRRPETTRRAHRLASGG